MAATLKIKNSSTPTTAPTGLTAGEMAVNLADRKLYIGGTAGTNVIFLDSTSVVGTTAGSYLSITNNTIKLDLQTGATANLSVGASKYDFIPILTIQNPTGVSAWNITGFSGPTQLISVPKLLNSAFPSLSQYTDGINNFADPILMGLSDGLTQAFNLFTIGVTTGAKASLFNIETDSGNGSLEIGVPTTITGQLTVDNTIAVNNLDGVTDITSNAGNITINASSGVTFTGNISARNIVNSFNGATGALQGVSAAVAGTGISVSGATGAVTITNTGVQTFNGLTGAVTGITAGGINTFTQLNTFSVGISASGATFTGLISGATATFSKDITVNSITVGVGSGGIDSNVAVGSNALYSNTEGEGNIGVGQSALYSNTNGNRNVAVGESALYNNTEGSNNVGVGRSALTANTTGSDNVGVGRSTLFSNTTGSGNIGVGRDALVLNTTGSNNVGVGRDALAANTTGSGNVGVGAYALGEENTSGSDNVAVGTYALAAIDSGSNNTAIGYEAGRFRGTGSDDNTTGTGGIYIGYQARGSTNGQTNEIVIGVDALGLGSNTAVIGATSQSAATVYGVLNLPSGLSASGATFSGNISAPNIVSSFNGVTGAVTGASLGANTFTALNTFSAGISASGATFNGLVDMNFNTLFEPTLRYYNEVLASPAITANVLTLDLSTAQMFTVSLNANITTFTISNTPVTANRSIGFTLIFTADGTARTVTWGAAVKWANNDPPALTSTNAKKDILSFVSPDGGTTWYGFIGGLNF